MKVLNFGSLNIDHVYRVPHIAQPGETLPGESYALLAGGKGANQSAALACAGAPVWHAGKVGPEGGWLIEKLATLGANTEMIQVGDTPTGHAIIQVDDAGQNAIVLFAGANHAFERADIDAAVGNGNPGDWLLLQNETNEVEYMIRTAHGAGLSVCYNPAPFTPQTGRYPLDLLSTLIVNETEGEALTRAGEPEGILSSLVERLPDCDVILTLGAAGVTYRCGDETGQIAAPCVDAVDTTAAGDTFIGYYIAACIAGEDTVEALTRACTAAALCVTRPGAMDSIPSLADVEAVP